MQNTQAISAESLQHSQTTSHLTPYQNQSRKYPPPSNSHPPSPSDIPGTINTLSQTQGSPKIASRIPYRNPLFTTIQYTTETPLLPIVKNQGTIPAHRRRNINYPSSSNPPHITRAFRHEHPPPSQEPVNQQSNIDAY